jgi:DNA-binding NtrC family response regulator
MTKRLYPEFAVLLVDDEPGWLRSLRYALARAGQITHVLECSDSRQVMEVLAHSPVGLVLLDLTMPHLSGEELLERIRLEHPEVMVLVVSGMNQLETAVRCMKAGAHDYFVKTTEEDRLVAGVQHAIRMIELQRENQRVASNLQSGALSHPEAFAAVVTRDRAMLGVFAYVEAVARSAHPILLTGESGTGKELIARAVHQLSGREGPLVAMNVAGLDDNVLSDTLFGHARGAFTGADQVRRGLIEEAADGTLFLDEIGDLSIPSQVKLLRLVQEGEYFPLGSDRPKRSRARLVAATHQDLAAKQAAGSFRRDLYFRLHTHHVNLPPLRERREDIPLLLEHFLAEAAAELGKRKPTAPPQLAQLLGAYGFPGNVRELKSMAFDAVSRHTGKVLSMESFIAAMGQPGVLPPGTAGAASQRNPFEGQVPLPTFREALDLLIGEAMSRSGGNQTIAARLLGVSQPTMSKRLKVLRGR